MMQQQKIFINSSFNGQQGLQQQTRGVLSALSVNTMNNSKAMNNNKSLSKLQEADLKQRTLHLIYQQVNEALGDSVSSNSSSSGEQQQSQAATRYKTELCRSFQENGICKYGEKCQFAHGTHELRNMMRHPKYKTELCRTFHAAGYCPYGPRCHFVQEFFYFLIILLGCFKESIQGCNGNWGWTVPAQNILLFALLSTSQS